VTPGRTGRFGRQGLSINFVHDRRSFENMHAIEKALGRGMIKISTDDFEEMEKVRAACNASPLCSETDVLTQPCGSQTLKVALKS
jgi:superfamily II DNA/RNA helicase